MLALISIYTESQSLESVILAISKLSNVEELYEVTGEYDIVTLVSATDIEEFRELLQNKIQKIKGVKSTVSSLVMRSHRSAR